MKLRELLEGVPVRQTRGGVDVDITSITPDSRLVRPGALFVAIPGTAKDGAEFVPQALDKGAAAICIEEKLLPSMRTDRSVIAVEDPRATTLP
jgi:UDP-N-acetylmuramoyl-L-alanyl-D-glutamate--2,6-diaminopimelate ligase